MSKLDQHTKTRFCPSPTGLLHLGNLRTALFSALLGKSVHGEFLLRIEDTDQERSEARYAEQLQVDLLWLGLAWQEGPGHDLGRGPYFQSQRGAIYADYYQRLETMGAVYPCFCSEEELALARKIQRAAGKPPRYPGTCQNLTEQQINAKLNEGKRPTLRFRVPLQEDIRFTDLVRGEQCFKSADLGDFIIRRTDGTAPFLFCNTVDDALMGVTHVLRGEDHVANTPRQILILTALGLPIPEYGHISLILAMDGKPLSKRNGSRSLVDLRNEGYLPQAIVNYLARLGHYYGHDQLLPMAELAAQFKLAALSTSPAKYNPDQLLFWQKQAIDCLSNDQLWEWLGQEFFASLPQGTQAAFLDMIKPNLLFPADAHRWAQIVFGDEIAEYDIQDAADPAYFAAALQAFEQHGAQAQKILEHLKTALQVKGKLLFQPLRLALTGEIHGPELGKLVALIEPKKIQQRLLKAKKRAENL